MAAQEMQGPYGGGRASHRNRSVASNLISYGTTVFLLLTFNFFLPRVLPGDPIEALVAQAGPNSSGADPAVRKAVAHYYRLDLPLTKQYGHYLNGILHGDLGVSIRFNEPVRRLIGRQLPWTILLALTSIALATTVASIAGIHAGWRRDHPVDRGITALFLSVRSIPPFFLASMVVFVMGVKVGWFPLAGADTPFSEFGSLRHAADIGYHLVLPVFVMAVQIGSFQYLLMRSSMVAEAGADYILMGRAKGLTERRLKYRHAARNALLPPLTQVAGQLGFALTGAILIETVFAYPGMGRLMFDSIGVRDYPVIQGCFLVLTLGIVGMNLVADLLYSKLDPRTVAQ